MHCRIERSNENRRHYIDIYVFAILVADPEKPKLLQGSKFLPGSIGRWALVVLRNLH